MTEQNHAKFLVVEILNITTHKLVVRGSKASIQDDGSIHLRFGLMGHKKSLKLQTDKHIQAQKPKSTELSKEDFLYRPISYMHIINHSEFNDFCVRFLDEAIIDSQRHIRLEIIYHTDILKRTNMEDIHQPRGIQKPEPPKVA